MKPKRTYKKDPTAFLRFMAGIQPFNTEELMTLTLPESRLSKD